MQSTEDEGLPQNERVASERAPAEAIPILRRFSQPTLLEHLADDVSILDASLRIMYVNRPSGTRLVGTSALERIASEACDDFRHAFASAWSSGSAQTCQTRSRDGTWLEHRLVRIADVDGVFHMLVTARDISAAKRDDADRNERESRLRSAIDASGVGSWSWSMLTGELVWDARMCEIWGLASGPASYAAYLETMHPHDLERVKTLVESFLTSGHFEEFEHRILRPSGEVRHLQCRAMAITDAAGTTTGMRGGVFDITDRKLLEERLRNAHRLQAVGQLTAGIAHNFNNLLSIILPSVELCRGVVPSDATEHLDDIENAAERAAEMVRQLMQFGRHELDAPKSPVALHGLVHRLLNICRMTFEPRIVIECDLPADLPPILACAGEIEQVLLNVCINARDALMLTETESPQIRLVFEHGLQGFVRVTISDNGPGIRSEVRARIFEPFFTTKGVGAGTGLGLASAYGIMRDHRGTIVCESEPGDGTSFIIDLPIASEADLAEPHMKSTAPHAGNGETILLVDDELALRRVLRIILEQAGFRVLEAQDGIAGLEALQRYGKQIDLIVLDRSMPRMSGEQFLLEMRRRKRQLPVVLLTGQLSSDPGSDGVAAVLLKPPASGELVRTIRSVLDRARALTFS